VGVGHSTLRGALQIAEEAISSGADGLLIMPPYFFPYGQAEIGHRRLLEFVDRIERFPAPIAIKRAVTVRGQKAGDPAVPLAPENAAALEEFAAWFQASLPAWVK
jgi:dihydrodipicolinate synthase/N-acetylneuraminate lyase